MANTVFVFKNSETGDFRSIVAPNESAARLWLSDPWLAASSAPLWRYCEVADLQSLIAEVGADEEAARQAMMASNPIGKHSFTSIDSITDFSDNQTRYAKLKACREQLSVLGAS
jgi:hypothetical protein